ncbi:putative phopshatase [Leptomonas pyrrhocoris]|uniref:Putative phopshatase n=1 Tax=Leptomonas pyrrhocoris TaxID=157538 RepID=A0A0M9G9H6_LEPPY|nr:putative phopshatase [Leptomonas pyrrhocoris]KPA85563.1 putative phopshatase [Leptomonas pyrrhocoris]|eukprot:XP_015664002.1 putative phopshatase [Leptomonas pyrrhocoris]
MSQRSSTSEFGAFGDWKSDGLESGSEASSENSSSIVSNAASGYSLLTASLSRGPRKLSMLPASDLEEEMRNEIEQSIGTGECNLSALGLSSVPSDLPVASLWKVSFAENKFTTLPASLFQDDAFANLVELDLNTNELASLPLPLFYLPKLEVLSLNTNALVSLPFEGVKGAERDAHGMPFLPVVRRVGMESNRLRRLPMEFLAWCPCLEELLLAMNESMLDNPVPYEKLTQLHRSNSKRVLLKVDNRPRFVKQMEMEKWPTTLRWLNVELNKIYPDKVLDFLYLGSLRTAQTVTVYHDLDIGYVLTAGRNLEVVVEPWMKQLVVGVDDYPEQGMIPIFEESFRFIDEARSNKKGVLIHCFAGMSRSVTIAVAYIMHLKGLTCTEALWMVRQARPAARPNEGFLGELKRYEGILKEEGIIKE